MKRVCFLFVLLLTIGFSAFAQDEGDETKAPETHAVSGKIMDELGHGLQGAYVSVTGSHAGANTDVNGDFMFEAPDGSHTIIVTANGYATVYIEDEGQSIEVKMQPLSKMLEGPVNTPIAFRREKRETGYNSNSLTGEDLMSGQNTSILSSLQGKIPGANITSSTGGFGGSTRVVLRGERSFAKNNNALIVVDGVPTNNYDRTLSKLSGANTNFNELNQVDFGNSANDLNPEDMESVTVLPPAAATAMYGAMGANGAIMYVTKKGKHKTAGMPGKMDITFKSTYTASDVLMTPSTQNIYGQGNVYGGIADDPREYRSWGQVMDGGVRPWGQVIDGKQLVKNYSAQQDNLKSFYNRGNNINNYIAINGGSDKSTYMLSMNSVNSTGVVPNQFYNRYGVRFNGTTELSRNMYSGINVNYINTYSRAEQGGLGAGSVMNSVINTPRDIPLWELSDLDNKYYSQQYYDTSGTERYGNYNGSFQNPYWIAKKYDNRNKSDRVLGDWRLGWKKNDWHVFNRLGVDASSDRSTYNMPQYNTAGIDPLYSAAPGFASAGGYTQSTYNGMRLYNDFIVNYTTELSNNFGVNAFVGHNMTFQRDETLAGVIDPANGGLVLPNWYNLQNNAGPVTGYNNKVDRRSVGLFGNVDFNYRRELFLGIAMRNDWSSTLARGTQSYLFPAVNGSWVFSERLNGSHFKEHVMNYGKIRMAAGGAGNDAISYANNDAGYMRGAFSSTYGSATYGGVNAYQVGRIYGDPSLRPERTRNFEVGTDLSFLRDRINASFTYYRAYTSNVIAPSPVPTSTGYDYRYINVGDVSNNGVELAIKGTPISTRYGLRWDLFATYTHNKNTVARLDQSVDHIVLGGFNGMQIVAKEGMPLGTFYAADIAYWQNPADGSWHAVVDQQTGLPVPTQTAVYKGSYQPKFIASWGTDVTYKGLKLHALFYTKQGGQYYSQTKMSMDANGTSEATTTNGRNAYVWENSVYLVPGTNIYLPNTTKASAYDYYTAQQQLYPAQGLVNSSFVRLQELSLSYKIPQRFYERSPFGALEAGVFGNNLLLWTANSNKFDDPDATSAGALGNGQGFNYMARPTTRNYGAFIKVNF
ncbi:MAG: SusC/RagA family TonB-linked outer membrane protein [Taibaiella sp.]|nr:SusC/RagA family TonB-linked outer membrane protein [Taibaiella sp.]